MASSLSAKFNFTIVLVTLVLLLSNYVNGKNLDHGAHTSPGHHSQLESNKDYTRESCNSMKSYFDSLDVAINLDYENKGPICSGHCCSNSTEHELKRKSTLDFERLLRHHTRSLRGILESTSSSFRNHVLELSRQSENKTLNIFSKVYRRIFPLSKDLIHDLYSNITSHLLKTSSADFNLDSAVHSFFVNLFPVAYHQAVHLNSNNNNNNDNDNAGANGGDLHEDYVNCLKHTYDDLQPFGSVPKEISKSLIQSVTTATVFINAIEQSAAVLASTDELDSMYLTASCQTQLLKMNYCPRCNAVHKPEVKPCYSYCLNVMRGCLAQYLGVLDNPWSNVADAIEHLVTGSVQSQNGIVSVIKGLDSKLSEAIMRAMENGPELERKVKKTCGKPQLLPLNKNVISTEDNRLAPLSTVKWATPPDAELLNFLSTIDRSKNFYSRIADNVCDDNIKKNDHNCWTGDRVGDYTHPGLTFGADTQRYNPEVPLEELTYSQTTKLNELVDKLIKIRSTIGNAIPSSTRSYSDIQSDMARHDDEGSGAGHIRDDMDDEEYNLYAGSGSGDGQSSTSAPDQPFSPRTIDENESQSSPTSSAVRIPSLTKSHQTLVLFVITTTCAFFSWH